MILVALNGESRSGKDETASILVRKYGFEQRVMADPIRALLLAINPLLTDVDGAIWDLQQLYERCHSDWNLVKKESYGAVDLMIRLGQGARDILGEGVWLAPVIQNLPERLCISDCRQPNEYIAFKGLGGEVWRVTREGTIPRGMDRLLEDKEFDRFIQNNGTLEELEGKIDDIMKEVLSDG